MDNSTELLAYELRMNHPGPDRETLARAAMVASRRHRTRHRFARQLRSVADRLDS